MDGAVADYDKNLFAFLGRCQERNLVLNANNLHLRQPSVTFIGHVALRQGISMNPAKVKAVAEMPAPTDKAGVQRLLGMVQYLSKFLPKLAALT